MSRKRIQPQVTILPEVHSILLREKERKRERGKGRRRKKKLPGFQRVKNKRSKRAIIVNKQPWKQSDIQGSLTTSKPRAGLPRQGFSFVMQGEHRTHKWHPLSAYFCTLVLHVRVHLTSKEKENPKINIYTTQKTK